MMSDERAVLPILLPLPIFAIILIVALLAVAGVAIHDVSKSHQKASETAKMTLIKHH